MCISCTIIQVHNEQAGKYADIQVIYISRHLDSPRPDP